MGVEQVPVIIDVTYPAGTLSQTAQAEVAAQLTGILMEIEGTPGVAAIAAGTWLLLHEAKDNTIAVGGKFTPSVKLALALLEN